MDVVRESYERSDELKPTDRDILNNFFWSFHHAQGNPTLQTLESIYLARQYRKEDIGSIEKFQVRLLPHIKRMRVPSEHRDELVNETTGEIKPLDQKEAQENEAGFESQWYRLNMVLNRVLYEKPDPRDMMWFGGYDGEVYRENKLTQNQLLAKILIHMTQADLKYQTIERPNRKEGSDPHESFFKTYSFDGQATNSPEHNRMYQDLRNLLEELGISQIVNGVYPSSKELLSRSERLQLTDEEATKLIANFTSLIQRWESKHPGKKFNSQTHKQHNDLEPN